VTKKIYVPVDEKGYRIGENHPMAKLSDKTIDAIRDAHENLGIGYRRLAVFFGLPRSTVRNICLYRRRASTIAGWKDVEK
jgi:hypothetical protein